MAKYLKNVLNPSATPQSQPIPGREAEMVKNNAGGYVFSVSDMKQLERWLILGSESASYYVGQQELTLENVNVLRSALAQNGQAVVDLITDISENARAPKNDPALFALALAASPKFADAATNSAALRALPRVARTGTHLMQFMSYIRKNKLRGTGRGLRTAISDWYLTKSVDQAAYQAVKYQNRESWSARDLFRVSHGHSLAHQGVIRWIVKGEIKLDLPVPPIIVAYEQAKNATTEAEVIKLIAEYGLTREMIPSQFLNSAAVWEALLQKMPLTAMVRNLGKMTAVGLIAPLSDAMKVVVERLSNQAIILKSRIHPVAMLIAGKTYESGHGLKGKLTWDVIRPVAGALDNAYYLAFGNINPSGKRFYLGVDVSGSMDGGVVAGVPNLTPRMAAAAMSMVTVRAEPNWYVRGFSDKLVDIPINAGHSLPQVCSIMERIPMGGTDCALPILDATKRKIPVDAFCVYSDMESWAGYQHPIVALQEYRQKMGIDAKLVTVDFVANRSNLAGKEDLGTLAVAGFDASVPSLISSFVGGGTAEEVEE